MPGGSLGTAFVEIDLDPSRYIKSQKRLYDDAKSTCLNIEENFKKLGIKSSYEMDLMRAKITNAYNMIANSSKATANDIMRAEKAKNDQLKALNEEQFGHQKSLIEGIKQHWIAASAAIYAAWRLIRKGFEYVELGAAAQRSEDAFRIMAESSEIAADEMIANMQRATKNVINSSDMMQKAIKLMSFDYTQEQIERFSKVVETAATIAGTTMAEAFDRLADSIGSRMPRAMYEMGAVTRDQMDIVQRAITAGADSVVFFELAMANLELQQLRLQGTTSDTSLAIEKFKKTIAETKEEIGKKLISVLESTKDAFKFLSAGVKGLTANMYNLISVYFKYREIVYDIIGAEEKAEKNRLKALEFEGKSLRKWEERNKLYNEVKQSILGLSNVQEKASKEEIENAKKRVKAQIEALQKIIEARKKQVKSHKEQLEKKAKLDEEDKNRVKDYTEEIERLYMRRLHSLIEGYQDIAESSKSSYDDIKYYAEQSFEYQLERFQAMKKSMKELGWTEDDWEKWYNTKAHEAEIKKQETILRGLKNSMKYSQDAALGIKVAFMELEKSAMTWSKNAYDMIKQFAESSQNTLSTVFFDAFKGKLKSFSDYWISFCDSMMKKFMDNVAQMMVQWVMFNKTMKVGSLLGNLFGGIGGAGTGGGTKISPGPVIPAAQGAAFDRGKIIPFEKGAIFDKPTVFPLGVMGEKGPEIILPVEKTKRGKLGIVAEGMGGTLNISIPLTINADSTKKQVAYLRSEIETTVKRVVGEWL